MKQIFDPRVIEFSDFEINFGLSWVNSTYEQWADSRSPNDNDNDVKDDDDDDYGQKRILSSARYVLFVVSLGVLIYGARTWAWAKSQQN